MSALNIADLDLLAVNLQTASNIPLAVTGNFSGGKAVEIVIVRGHALELLRLDESSQLVTVCSTPAFAIIRSLITFRLAGANRDHVVLGSDSGKLSVIEFDNTLQGWKVVHCEVFGKTGCRRIVPGQYLAADPKGRAIMIGAIEKQKFVYILNRDSSNKLTISSPLEAHKAETVIFSMCGVDVGYENPVFAMIELEYSEADQDPTGEALQETDKKLSYYELDLGLNHVVRKWSEPISRTANFLIGVPGGDTFPSGVLVCGENWISYKHQGHVEVRAPLPRRATLPVEKGTLIVTGSLFKKKDSFFFLLQSEYGDLYKVTLEKDEMDTKIVKDIVVELFDTIPLANCLCITKSGHLFTASEFGNHYLFQFLGLEDETAVKSRKIADESLNEELGDDSESASKVAPIFHVRDRLQNLSIVDRMPSLAPIMDMVVDDLQSEDAVQMYAVCGRGNLSTFRTLRHGISVSEMAVSPLGGQPTAVWTIKKNIDDSYDSYIIVSCKNNTTMVLSVSDNIEEVQDSGFLLTTATLQVALLADNAMIQVHPHGIRHIRPDQRISEWKVRANKTVQIASVNSRQVAIALSGGEITYFEMDETGQLIEMSALDMGKEISCLDVGGVPEGKLRCGFLAVGYWDDTCQLLSLDPSNVLGSGPAFPLDSRPTSICLVEMIREISNYYDPNLKANQQKPADVSKQSLQSQQRSLYLNIGLERGILMRINVDPITGDLSDPRPKYLGPRSIKLCRVNIQQQMMVMALSSRSWLFYNYRHRYHQDPLSYVTLEHVCDFSSERCPNGLVAVTGNTLRVLSIENLGNMFNEKSTALNYTPRRICRIPNTSLVAIVEADMNEYDAATKAVLEAQNPTIVATETSADEEDDEEGTSIGQMLWWIPGSPVLYFNAIAGDESCGLNSAKVPVRGLIPAGRGVWASCVRIVDALTHTTRGVMELADNEAACSVCTVRFQQHSEETFIIVGTHTQLSYSPAKHHGMCYLHVYRNLDGNLQLLHKTEVEEIPLAMTEFQGKLLVGIGRQLRLYDMGKKQLLKKCDEKNFPSVIVRLAVLGDRIFVGDNSQSVVVVKYKKQENVFAIFADDSLPRFITCLCVVDYHTVACGDKFGNFFTLFLPETSNDEMALQPGNLWDHGLLNGAPNKLMTTNHYYLGEIPTFITKVRMKTGGKEILLVATISGGIFALVPNITKEDGDFFRHLEMFMRQEYSSLCQRDHLLFRSFYHPVRFVVDLALCELFMTLPSAKQLEFADSVDRKVPQIIKKLEEIYDFV